MNPFTIRFLWKGLTGKSLVFSLLFATAMLGYSGAGFIRGAFAGVGVPWWLVWIIPIILIGWVAKREESWIPGERYRKYLSYSIIGFSVVFSYVLWQIDASTPEYEAEETQNERTRKSAGPPSKR